MASRKNLVKSGLAYYVQDKSRGGCRGWFPGPGEPASGWGGAAMCDDQAAANPPRTAESELSRRGFLHATAAVAGAAALRKKLPRRPLRSSAPPGPASGAS